jgi:putative endonuclease
MREHHYYVYIATNKRNTVLYTGVTNSLIKREGQHKMKFFDNSFAAKYNVEKIIYYEIFGSVGAAIFREKQIKAGSRQDKINLVNSMNLSWKDLLKEEN